MVSSFYKLGIQKRGPEIQFLVSYVHAGIFLVIKCTVFINILWRKKCCKYWLIIQVTYRRMKDALIQLSKGVQKGPASDLIPVLFGERQPTVTKKNVTFTLFNSNLDHSQVRKFNLLYFSYTIKGLLFRLFFFLLLLNYNEYLFLLFAIFYL